MKKTIDVLCKDGKQVDNLAKFKSEDPDALDRVLNAGYNEGIDDGVIHGFAIAGLSLLAACGIGKLLKLIGK